MTARGWDRALLRGAVYIVLAELLFASMGALIKVAASELPNAQLVFFRNVFGVAVLLPWLLRRGRDGLRTAHLPVHMVRALAGLSAMYCFFYALGHIPLAEAVLLKLTAPLFLPLVALAWLGERVSGAAAAAVLVGFVGVALILKPGPGAVSPVALVGLAGGALAALAVTAVRRLTETEPDARIVLYFAVLSTPISAVPALWHWVTPSTQGWVLLGLIGLLATLAQLLMTRGFALAPAARVGPFTYTSVLFATVYGFLFWGEHLDALAAAGAGLVIAAGLLTSRQPPARSAAPVTTVGEGKPVG